MMREERYDVIVAGAGSAGIGAALTAARAGLSVLLVEERESIGGTAGVAGVSMWESGVGGTGIPLDIYCRLREVPQAVGVYSLGRHFCWQAPEAPDRFPGGEHVVDPHSRYRDTLRRYGSPPIREAEAFRRKLVHGVVFEPEIYCRVVRAMLEETGRCDVRTGVSVRDVFSTDGAVERVVLSGGLGDVAADTVIDATGDVHLCRMCGCDLMVGQESRDRFGEPAAPPCGSNRLNGVTLIYRVTRVASPRIEALPDGIPDRCWWADRFPSMSAVKYPCGDYNCNMLPTLTGEEFVSLGATAALVEARRRVLAHWHHVQTDYPEFRRYRRVWTAPMLGVREGPRVVGEYVLTQHDLVAGIGGQRHDDIVALADHSMDVHGYSLKHGELSQPYGIPFRCLVPKGFKNLLVACRGSSFSALAASSCRLSRTIMQLGQAAGAASVLARSLGVPAGSVPGVTLRKVLREQNVQLDCPMPEKLAAYVDSADAVSKTERTDSTSACTE